MSTTLSTPYPDEAVSTDEAHRELRTRLFAFIARRVADAETAEDLTQDVMLRLARHGPEDLVDPMAWLFRVARNVLIDHYRRRRDLELVGVDHRPLERAAVDPFAEDPGDSLRELSKCLPPLVERLPEPYRSAVRAVDLDGFTHAAAAQGAGITVPGMKSRVQRGRQRLRRMLTDCCTIEFSPSRGLTDYSPAPGCAPGGCFT